MTTLADATTISVRALGVEVQPGPALLSGVAAGPSLAEHRRLRGPIPDASLDELVSRADRAVLRGRGGAGFPFAAKLRAVRRARRPEIVVNVCEGEPLSAKDAVLSVFAPHLLLDGATLAARALGSRTVHLVAPGERAVVAEFLGRAVAERDPRADRVRFELHTARPGFVSGQASAVLELVAGRENLPVTRRRPATEEGLNGRPTVLSNAETWAQLACLLLEPPSLHAARRPGQTTLLTVNTPTRRRVLEVGFGTPWPAVLGPESLAGAVLVGGFHGRWAAPGQLARLSVSHGDLAGHGLLLGAGVTFVPRGCPVVATVRILTRLARESAGRCGPCLNGLPALARLVDALAEGRGDPAEVGRVASLVTGRGACAHPDGTAAMAASALSALAGEFAVHARRDCSWTSGGDDGR